MISVVPTGTPTSDALMISVGPARRGRKTTCWPRAMISMVPPDTTAQPTATRNPLPSAPRSGLRRYFVEIIGR
jgi:hypothetical protein